MIVLLIPNKAGCINGCGCWWSGWEASSEWIAWRASSRLRIRSLIFECNCSVLAKMNRVPFPETRTPFFSLSIKLWNLVRTLNRTYHQDRFQYNHVSLGILVQKTTKLIHWKRLRYLARSTGGGAIALDSVSATMIDIKKLKEANTNFELQPKEQVSNYRNNDVTCQCKPTYLRHSQQERGVFLPGFLPVVPVV